MQMDLVPMSVLISHLAHLPIDQSVPSQHIQYCLVAISSALQPSLVLLLIEVSASARRKDVPKICTVLEKDASEIVRKERINDRRWHAFVSGIGRQCSNRTDARRSIDNEAIRNLEEVTYLE